MHLIAVQADVRLVSWLRIKQGKWIMARDLLAVRSKYIGDMRGDDMAVDKILAFLISKLREIC